MQLTLEIPDELGAELRVSFDDLEREMLESIVARAYSKGVFSLEQVRLFLNEESRWHAQRVLENHGAWPGDDPKSIEKDLLALETFIK